MLDPSQLYIPYGNHYQDSPELPARRIASEWEDFRHSQPLPEPRRSVFTKFGHGTQVVEADPDDGDGEVWDAYGDAITQTLKKAGVRLVLAYKSEYYKQWYPTAEEDPYPSCEVFSLYAVDLLRWEPDFSGVPVSEDGEALFEGSLQEAIRPRTFSLMDRLRRRFNRPIKPPAHLYLGH